MKLTAQGLTALAHHLEALDGREDATVTGILWFKGQPIPLEFADGRHHVRVNLNA